MKRHTRCTAALASLAVSASCCFGWQKPCAADPLTVGEARVRVTGPMANPPDPFLGWGGFGWPGNIAQLPGGELLMCHSAGYWHVSFAEPRRIAEETRRRWLAGGWPLDVRAPTGGRSMLVRSADGGRTWSKPKTILDLPWDDGACGLLVCDDGTLVCSVNVQASWYGFDSAPRGFEEALGGLNTRQCVIRSNDGGRTWSEPIWIQSPGEFYERSHSQLIQLPSGAILWPTYCADAPSGPLFGAVHLSLDRGKTWRLLSTVRRKDQDVDEPALARLSDGRLTIVSRPDGGLFTSSDEGRSWTEAGRMVASGVVKAPRLFVLEDDTVVCVCTYNGSLHAFIRSPENGRWSKPIVIDRSAYGYPGGLLLADQSLLVSYTSSGRAPSDIYVVRLRVNDARDAIGFEPLPFAGP